MISSHYHNILDSGSFSAMGPSGSGSTVGSASKIAPICVNALNDFKAYQFNIYVERRGFVSSIDYWQG